MIPLSLDDCKLKVCYYTDAVAGAKQAEAYLLKPDKKREKQLQAVIRKLQLLASKDTDPQTKRLHEDLADAAQLALDDLPQNLSDDELASRLADHRRTIEQSQRKLKDALDELEALEHTPELFEETKAAYTDLPPSAIGEPLYVMDNGTVLLMSGMVITAAEINLYRTRKVFGNDVEVLDG